VKSDYYIARFYPQQRKGRGLKPCYDQTMRAKAKSTESATSSRLHVTTANGDTAPFLRGILTRSLQKVGLTFPEAYGVASTVRENLSSSETVSSEVIRDEVSRILVSQFGPGPEERYRLDRAEPVWVKVFGDGREDVWFSRTIFRYRLEVCGIPHQIAEDLAHRMHERLINDYASGIDRKDLHRLSFKLVLEQAGSHFARHLEAWHKLAQGKKTLIILIGGASGVGKSTAATLLSARLNITRTQSTDMLREVLRTLRSSAEAPELHYSSFNAWKALGTPASKDDLSIRIRQGFDRQADEVETGVRALLERAQKEQAAIIVEGVHIRPSIIKRLSLDPDVILIPIVLMVDRQKTLRRFFEGRSMTARRRPGKHYLNNMSAIWELQSFIVSQAIECNVPVIVNEEEEINTMVRVFSVISSAVADAVMPEKSSKSD